MPTQFVGIECDGCGVLIEDGDPQSSLEDVFSDAVAQGWKTPGRPDDAFGYQCPKCVAARQPEQEVEP